MNQTKPLNPYSEDRVKFKKLFLPASESVAKAAMWLVERIANVAIFIDVAIGAISRKLFALIPESIQSKLQNLNSEYIEHRNRLLKIEFSEKSPEPSIDEHKTIAEKMTLKGEEFSRHEEDLLLQKGDVPGWVLVVLMTTGLVTALWTIAAPRLSQILRNSLDSMNGIR